MSVRLAVVLAGTLAVAGSSRLATASNRPEDRCDDAVFGLRELGRSYEAVGIEPGALPAARAHRATAGDLLEGARAAIEAIPASALDERDPAITSCLGELDAWTQYLEALDGRIAVAAIHVRVIAPFLAQVQPLEPSLRVMLAIAADPGAPTPALATPADLANVLDDLAIVDGACVGVPLAARTAHASDRLLPVEAQVALPSTWCRIAAQRGPLALAFLGARRYAVGPAGLRAAIAPWYRAADLPVTAHVTRAR